MGVWLLKLGMLSPRRSPAIKLPKTLPILESTKIFGKKALININRCLDVLATKFSDMDRWILKVSISYINSSNTMAVIYLQFFCDCLLKQHLYCTIFVKLRNFWGKKPLPGIHVYKSVRCSEMASKAYPTSSHQPKNYRLSIKGCLGPPPEIFWKRYPLRLHLKHTLYIPATKRIFPKGDSLLKGIEEVGVIAKELWKVDGLRRNLKEIPTT